MGKKGARMTPESEAYAEALVERLAGLGTVTCKKMFGGFGMFESGVMFGLVSGTTLHLRVDDETRPRYEAAGATQHRPMPYFSVPPAVEKRSPKLMKWAREAVAVSKAAARKKKKPRAPGKSAPSAR